MRFRPLLGQSDFRLLREDGGLYVDKTRLVADVLDAGAQALLLPRPRRFGKTLNLSTLRHFLERSEDDLGRLFEGLAVWESEAARAHFQRYPVVFLTFKDVKARAWEDCLVGLRDVITREVERHETVLEDARLSRREQATLDRLLAGDADKATLRSALRDLTAWLGRATGERVVVLVDEYDTPIHAGFSGGYYDEVVELFRNLLSGALKDNPHLLKGVLTGILRVAKESIFSGLNNLAVHTLLSSSFSTAFGFTEEEVEALCAAAGDTERIEDVRRWYDGYLFGGQVVYNPWSVLNYLDRLDDGLQAYWVSVSSDDVLRRLLVERGLGGAGALEALLSGEGVERRLDQDIVLRDVEERPDAVWSFLLFSGYLKAEALPLREGEGEGERRFRLTIPNREVRQVYQRLFSRWLEQGAGGGERVRELCRALLAGDALAFEARLEELLLNVTSYHDAAGRQPERAYQGFVLGLLAYLEPEYEVRSNRESGFGRYDVSVSPRRAGRPGAVLELKVVDRRRGETAETALESALAQVRDRAYAADLRARGADPVHELAAVFDGKRAWVQVAEG